MIPAPFYEADLEDVAHALGSPVKVAEPTGPYRTDAKVLAGTTAA